MYISGKECARARESVSADLDRELHELDHRRLQAHLRVCADCSDWAERDRAIVLTAVLTGLRADELLRADVGNIRSTDEGV